MAGQPKCKKGKKQEEIFLKFILMSLFLFPEKLYLEIFRELLIVIMQPWLTILENNFMNGKSAYIH